MAEFICADCGESLVSDQTLACPHCGSKPSEGHWRWAKIDAVLGIICFGSVIGSPLGLYFLWKVVKHRKMRNASPAIAV